MFGSIIGRRVWKAIKAKIAAAQKRYEDGCAEYEEIRDQRIETARQDCEDSKVMLADRLVNEIIG